MANLKLLVWTTLVIIGVIQLNLALAVRCPTGFTALKSATGVKLSCIRLTLTEQNYNRSAEICANYHPGAHLVTVEDEEKNEALKAYLKHVNFEHHPCGGFQTVEAQLFTAGERAIIGDCTSSFYWIVNNDLHQLNYTDFYSGEPSCSWYPEGYESCITFAQGFDFQWNDSVCAYNMCAICEYDE